jgi:hypothetical protein
MLHVQTVEQKPTEILRKARLHVLGSSSVPECQQSAREASTCLTAGEPGQNCRLLLLIADRDSFLLKPRDMPGNGGQ